MSADRQARGRDMGVSVVLGAVLLMGVVTSWLAMVSVTYVPEWQKDREARHMEEVARELTALVSTMGLQAQNRTGDPLPTRITLGGGGSTILFPSARISHEVESVPGGATVQLDAPKMRLQARNGTRLQAINETWNGISGNETTTNIDTIESLRLKVDEVDKTHDGDSIVVKAYDADNALVAEFMVTVVRHAPDYGVVFRTKNGAGAVVYEEEASYFQNQEFSPYWVDVMPAHYQFITLVHTAKGPRKVTLVEDGMTGEYAMTHTVWGSGGLVRIGGGGQLIEPYSSTYAGGRLTYEGPNTYYVSQDLIVEHGALILSQPDGSLFRVQPPWRAVRSGAVVGLTVGLPQIAGTASSVVGSGALAVKTTPANHASLVAEAPEMTINVSTQHAGLWAAFMRDRMASVSLVEGTGFTITQGADWVRLRIIGPSADANTYDVQLVLQQAKLDTVVSTTVG